MRRRGSCATTAPAGAWLTVIVEDKRGGLGPIGTLVTVKAGGRTQRRDIASGDSYLSTHDPRPHFGLGSATTVDEVDVRWPDGSHTMRKNVPRAADVESASKARPDYSSLSADIGAMRDARRAGTIAAIAATVASAIPASRTVKVSAGETPYNWACTYRPSHHAAPKPRTSPTPTRMAASRSTRAAICDASVLSAWFAQ